MDRITANPNYAINNCSDICGLIARDDNHSGRLTCQTSDCSDCIILKAFERLKQYEDTGFSPEQIQGVSDLIYRFLVDKERAKKKNERE